MTPRRAPLPSRSPPIPPERSASGRRRPSSATARRRSRKAQRAAEEAAAAGLPIPARPRPNAPAPTARPLRAKCFGDGRPIPLDRNAKVRVMMAARALMRRTEPGKAYGAISAKTLAVLNARARQRRAGRSEDWRQEESSDAAGLDNGSTSNGRMVALAPDCG